MDDDIVVDSWWEEVNFVGDSSWEEVRFINPYALFMGYLSMAIRGLGFLAITWTTVVLLGGFVSTLGNKDFWCLTMISLLQTAGVYDVFLNEKLGYIHQSVMVFWARLNDYENDLRSEEYDNDRRLEEYNRYYGLFGGFMLRCCAGAVKTLVLGIVLCPLMALYMFGLLISMGISLWRLIEHDFGDGEAHLKPALQVLYSLAVLQGSLFIYRFTFSLKEKGLVKRVAKGYKFDRDRDGAKLVREYSRQLRIGCEKDPTFANGRNLVTFAVDLIKTESPANYISGVTILERIAPYRRTMGSMDRLMLMKQLIGTTPSCTILQKLVQTLHESSPYDVDTRIRAARIVGYFADHFYLEQFPRGTQCIISLLSEACSRQQEKKKIFLVMRARENVMDIRSSLAEQGLLILCKLAADEDNCRLISTTHGLVSKIMAPVVMQGLHDRFHDVWSRIARRSLALLARLMENAPGEAGESLRHEISSNNAVISTIETAFTCVQCRHRRLELPELDVETLQQLPELAVEILLYKSIDRFYVMPPATKEEFVKIMAYVIVDDSKKDSLRTMACENLKGLCIQCTKNGECPECGQKLPENVMETLLCMPDATKGIVMKAVAWMIVNDRRKNSLRTMACENLKDLCTQCTENAELLQQLVEALTDVMQEVLKEIVPLYGSYAKIAGDVMQTSTEGFSAPGTDVEKGRVSHRDDEQHVYKKLSSQPYYLSLCVAIRDTLISAYPDLARWFDRLAADNCRLEVKSFACLVNEWQQFVDEKKKKYGGHSTTVSKGNYRMRGQMRKQRGM